MTEPTGVPFETGQTVVLGAGPEPARRWFRTTVQRMDARVVWLDGAPKDQPLVDVQPGEVVTCHTWRHMDALYEVQARVAFSVLAPDPMVGLTIQSAERIQQREYVRVPLSTEASAMYVGSGAVTEAFEPKPLRLAVCDLSAGGLRGRSSLALGPGDELEIDLPLPRLQTPPRMLATRPGLNGPEDDPDAPLHLHGRVVTLAELPKPLNLRARVVRLVEAPLNDELICEIGVEFVDVSRQARERIIRFAMDVQRDRRRRGLL
jgi:hypothetical protein